MLNFQGTVYIKLVLALWLTLLGGSILSVKPGSILIVNQYQNRTTSDFLTKINCGSFFIFAILFLHKKKPQPSISQGLRDILYLMKF